MSLDTTLMLLLELGDFAKAYQSQVTALANSSVKITSLQTQLDAANAEIARLKNETPTPTPSVLKPPGSNFDLSAWKITLPVDINGTFSGTAVEVKQPALNTLTNNYFHTASDGSMEFVVPTDGAKTSGSNYPRSELREMVPGGSEISWTVSQGSTLSATLSVMEMPVSSDPVAHPSRIVIGQIHGPDDELCRLYFEDDKSGGYRLHFHDDKALKSGTTSTFTETEFALKNSTGEAPKLSLGQRFSYVIKVENNVLTVTAIINGVSYSASDKISSFWPAKALYFKVGLYSGVGKVGSSAGTVGTGKAVARFYNLSKPTHP